MRLLSIIFLFTITVSAQRSYQKSYFKDGTLKEEGWQKNKQKVDYWKFYHSNGEKQKEGHYKNGQASKYWYFYRPDGTKESERVNGGCFMTTWR